MISHQVGMSAFAMFRKLQKEKKHYRVWYITNVYSHTEINKSAKVFANYNFSRESPSISIPRSIKIEHVYVLNKNDIKKLMDSSDDNFWRTYNLNVILDIKYIWNYSRVYYYDPFQISN